MCKCKFLVFIFVFATHLCLISWVYVVSNSSEVLETKSRKGIAIGFIVKSRSTSSTEALSEPSTPKNEEISHISHTQEILKSNEIASEKETTKTTKQEQISTATPPAHNVNAVNHPNKKPSDKPKPSKKPAKTENTAQAHATPKQASSKATSTLDHKNTSLSGDITPTKDSSTNKNNSFNDDARDNKDTSHTTASNNVAAKGIDNGQLEPIDASSLSLVYAPTLAYPPRARRLGQDGTTILLLELNATGSVTKVSIRRSSGFQILDDSAVDYAKKLKYSKDVRLQNGTKAILNVSFVLK